MKRTLFVFILTILLLPSVVVAKEVTKEDIENSFSNFNIWSNSTLSDTSNYFTNINVGDSDISFSTSEASYSVKYKIEEDNILFYNIDTYTSETTYDDISSDDNFDIMFYSFLIGANTQGVEFDDATAYFLEVYIELFESISESDNSVIYIVVDDDTDVTSYSGTFRVKKSEFGKTLLENPDKMLQVYDFTDSNNLLSFVASYEESDDSIDYTRSLKIYTNANFSVIEGAYEKYKSQDDDTKKDNNAVELSNSITTQVLTNVPNTSAKNNIQKYLFSILLILLGISIVYSTINKKSK